MRKHSKRDASNTNITVYGISAINEPNLPPMSTNPLKASTVVIVAVNTGRPIKVAAFLAALYGSSFNIYARHVNRTPCAGKISQIVYKPGKFFNASLDKASEENERNYYKVQNSSGEDIIVVQIAGLIARRIVNESHEGQELKQGERIGMIRFGSRADIYFENYKPLVKVNQKTIAGETLIAKK